jgi:hypothetical protein
VEEATGRDFGLRKWRAILMSAVAFGLPAPSLASGHEVDRSSLRQAIAEGSAIPFSDLQEKVETRMAGALVDVSLYDVGSLYYRVLVRQPDGRMVSAVLEARTGSFVPVSSDAARAVQDTARTRSGGGFLGLFSPTTRPGATAAPPGPPEAAGAATGGASSGSTVDGAGGSQSTSDPATGSAGGSATGGGQSSSPASAGGGNAGNDNAGGGNAGGGAAGNGNSGNGNAGNAGNGNTNAGGGNANAGGGNSGNAAGGNGNSSNAAGAGAGNGNAGGATSNNGNGRGRN